jgi:hypothetical protein
MYTAHLVMSDSPLHIPLRLPFASAARARDLCQAAIASPGVLRAYVAIDGTPLPGHDYRRSPPTRTEGKQP